jgi:hypothetical protein
MGDGWTEVIHIAPLGGLLASLEQYERDHIGESPEGSAQGQERGCGAVARACPGVAEAVGNERGPKLDSSREAHRALMLRP